MTEKETKVGKRSKTVQQRNGCGAIKGQSESISAEDTLGPHLTLAQEQQGFLPDDAAKMKEWELH